VANGVHGYIIFEDTVVQMHTRCAARSARNPQRLPNANRLTRMHKGHRQMAVNRMVRIEVVDADVAPQALAVPDCCHPSRCPCPNVLMRAGNVDTVVMTYNPKRWVIAPAKFRRNPVARPVTEWRQTRNRLGHVGRTQCWTLKKTNRIGTLSGFRI